MNALFGSLKTGSLRRTLLGVAVVGIGLAGGPAAGQAIRHHEFVDVRAFGAGGAGRTDDSAAFERALAAIPRAGGTLFVPSGDYRIGRSLTITRGDITIECGANARFVVAGKSVKLLQFRGELAPGSRIGNVRVAGCRFFDPDPLGHVGNEESHGILLRNVDGATLERLEFVDLGDEAVNIVYSRNVRLIDSHARGGCAAVAVPHVGTFTVTHSSRVQIRGNVLEGNRNGAAIRVEVSQPEARSEYVVIARNQIFDPADAGALGAASGSGIAIVPGTGQASALTITGNQIVDPFRYGIYVHPVADAVASALTIQGNTIVGGGAGIATRNGPNHGAIVVAGNGSVGAVVGNVVRDWGDARVRHAGLRLAGEGLTVVANAVWGVTGAGIDHGDPRGTGSAILGNLLQGGSGLEAGARHVVGLNKTRADGTIRLGGLFGCSRLATNARGDVICLP